MRGFLVSVFAALVFAAPAAGEVRTLAEVHAPTRGAGTTAFPVIDGFRGRVVWSDYDASAGAWRLMEHAGGVTRAVPVAPRSSPFDVDLGPDGRGGTVAVYSRCRRPIPFDRPTPVLQRRAHACDLHAFSFTTRRESAIRAANSRADEWWPTVWGSRIAFVRAYANRRDRFGRRIPYLYWRSSIGSGPSHRLRRPSAVITIRMSGPEGRTVERRRLASIIEAPDLRGRSVAYAWSRVDDDVTDSFIYLATTGGRLRAVARGATTGGGAADSLRRVDAPSLGAGGRVDWRFENSGGSDWFGAFLARGVSGPVRASRGLRATAFAGDGRTAYWIDGGTRAVAYPTNQPGGTFALQADDAVAYGALPSGWLWVRPP
jgi:hypothetical protein